MLWLAYAALLVPLGVVCFLVVGGFVLGQPGDAVLAVLLGTQAAVALAVGVAVTRYRLYEIDRLINRTLVYSVVTASLGLLMPPSRCSPASRRPRLDLGDGARRARRRMRFRAAAPAGPGRGRLALRPSAL